MFPACFRIYFVIIGDQIPVETITVSMKTNTILIINYYKISDGIFIYLFIFSREGIVTESFKYVFSLCVSVIR